MFKSLTFAPSDTADSFNPGASIVLYRKSDALSGWEQ